MTSPDASAARARAVRLRDLARVRRLAREALRRWGIDQASLTLLGDAENTVFRVETIPPEGGRDLVRFVLRIHRPHYQTAASIECELSWLSAIKFETSLAVPEAIPTREGSPVAEVVTDELDQPYCCTLLTWVEGRFHRKPTCAATAGKVGRLLAQLHRHAQTLELPEPYPRRAWDEAGIFTDVLTRSPEAGSETAAFEAGAFSFDGGDSDASGPFLTDEERSMIARARRIAASRMDALGRGTADWGLIHADLHLGNIVFLDGEAHAFDFDDCGPGHYAFDIATSLWAARIIDDGARYAVVRDALVEAYRREHHLANRQVHAIDVFLAAKLARGLLRYEARAARDPEARAELRGRAVELSAALAGVLTELA